MEPLTRRRPAYIARIRVMKNKLHQTAKAQCFCGTAAGRVKLKAPYLQGQGRGAEVDPMQSPIPASRYEDLVRTLSSAVSSEVKHKLIKRAVSQCPAVPMGLFGRGVPSLLDSGSMVTLIREGYFTKYIQPLLKKPSSKMAEAHSLFRLSAANNEIYASL